MRERFDFYELREDPDDLPRVFPTERAAVSYVMRHGEPLLLYGINERGPRAGETYLGEVA